jgi:hypothetical protein
MAAMARRGRAKEEDVSEATEMLEHMEHAGHGGHGDHKGPGKGIGITMAILGVMLALCAAMVGSQRTELIKTMVEQSNKWGLYQSESMKYRVMEGDYEILHALTPSKAEVKKFELQLSSVKARSGRADDEDTAELKEAVDVATRELAEILSPDKEDEDRFAKVRDNYKRDMVEAKEDAEAYDGAIEAHQEAAEWYERAQLCAEIGIVIASIALLLASRAAWTVAIVIGIVGAGIIGTTFVRTKHELEVAEKKIEQAAKNTAAIEQDDGEEGKPSEAHEGKPGEAHEGKPGEAHEGKPSEAHEGKPGEKEPPKAEQKPGEPKPGSGQGHGDGKGPGGGSGGGEHNEQKK